MKRKWIQLARAALALIVSWQTAAVWLGTERAGAVPVGDWLWEPVGTGAVENSFAQTLDIEVHDNVPYLFYNVGSGGGRGIVKSWDGSSWATVGGGYVTPGHMGSASLNIGQDGQIYATYVDGSGSPYHAVVRKLSGGAWVELGDGGFLSSPAGADYTGVVAGTNGKPTMYYQERGSFQTFIRQFDGTVWTTATVVTGNYSNLPNLTMTPQGQPAMIFADGSTGYYRPKAIVYDGNAWQTLGNDQFSSVSAHYPSLRFASDGTAYAVFKNGNAPDNGIAYLYRLSGGTWEKLAEWNAHGMKNIDLAISPLTNAPFVAYIDRSGKAEVKTWNGSALIDTTSTGGLAMNADNVSLAFGENGEGYLAFTDGANHPVVIRYAPEKIPPSVTGMTPSAGATDVDRGESLTVTFDEPIKSVPGHDIEICKVASTECQLVDAGSANVSVTGNVATIDVPTELRKVTSYRAVAEAGAFADLNDNPAPTIEWTFTTAATVPDAPEITEVLPWDGEVTVLFNAPDSGGSNILSYRVTIHPMSGGVDFVEDTPGMVYTKTGLTNGVTYGVTISAVNSVGSSAPSTMRTFVPSTVPSAPTITGVEVGNRKATVSFEPPVSDGSNPITEYQVLAKQDGVLKRGAVGSESPITVTGLTNGETYSFTVVAVNANGPSEPSADLPGTPATVPTPPASVTATAGIEQATVSFTPSTNNGGSPITGYRITTIPGNAEENPITMTVGPNATSAVVSGLRNGGDYQFKVAALNALGASAETQTVVWTQLPAVPAGPYNIFASAGDRKAIVSFNEPENGGMTITKYRVTASAGTATLMQIEGSSSPIEVTGLQNGTAYTFVVEAYNEVGWSEQSDSSNIVTPSTVPQAPTNVTATAGNGSAVVSYYPSFDNGGSPITEYRVTAWKDDQNVKEATGTSGSITISGLTNGTAYTFTVVAINANGASPASTASSPVTPTAPGSGNIGPPPVVSPEPSRDNELHLTVGPQQGGSGEIKGVVKLKVPAGAVSREGKISVSIVAADQAPSTGGLNAVSQVVEFSSTTGHSFDKPVEITFYYGKDKVGAGSRAAVYYYNELQHRWIYIGGTVNEDGTITISVNHFTKFAVFEFKPTSFSDLAGHWATAFTERLVGMHVIQGYPDQTFHPNETVTRAQFAKMLAEALGLPATANATDFADDDEIPDWSKSAVASAAKLGLISGYPGQGAMRFRADRTISRAEMAVMIARALSAGGNGAEGAAGGTARFKDSGAIPEWAQAAVETAVSAGILNGYEDGTFRPYVQATRAEAAAMIYKLLGVLKI
ncbi:fibronectin type III domain-containing protein [Cohnella soli]|uniref:Fibronectin type III domain-containing protein n=1 Tax=Cohnella soli TaxID=425005 RepID=A0ABW0I352_9BACL